MLPPSAEHVGGVVVTVGAAGGGVSALLLKDALAAEGHTPSSAVTV